MSDAATQFGVRAQKLHVVRHGVACEEEAFHFGEGPVPVEHVNVTSSECAKVLGRQPRPVVKVDIQIVSPDQVRFELLHSARGHIGEAAGESCYISTKRIYRWMLRTWIRIDSDGNNTGVSDVTKVVGIVVVHVHTHTETCFSKYDMNFFARTLEMVFFSKVYE